MQNNEPTLGVLITTMNSGINRVKNDLLPQLIGVDEIIISHQITDKNIKAENGKLGKNVKYFHMHEKGLSKNRNKALKYCTTDVCHICDDDINYIVGFENIIKNAYKSNGSDIITFQAKNEKGGDHFKIKEGKHSEFSILRVWSWGVTFSRKSILEKKLYFDENFGLGAKYPVGEENIFLHDCYKSGLRMNHINTAIVTHPDESSGHDYRDELVISRIKVWKRMLGLPGGILAIMYFTVFDYKNYKNKYGVGKFLALSFKSLVNRV